MSNSQPKFAATTTANSYVHPQQAEAAAAHPAHLSYDAPPYPKAASINEKTEKTPSSSFSVDTDSTCSKGGEKTFCPVSDDALIPIPRVPKGQPAPPKHRAPALMRFFLWYNTYRKFYTFVVCLNFACWVTTLTGHWSYPLRYPGAMVLGNLLAAVLVRNEVFGRFLYAIVNNCFAKVCLSVESWKSGGSYILTVATAPISFGVHFGSTAPWWNSLRMCHIWISLAHYQRCRRFPEPQG
jgi:hypothetical protein